MFDRYRTCAKFELKPDPRGGIAEAMNEFTVRNIVGKI